MFALVPRISNLHINWPRVRCVRDRTNIHRPLPPRDVSYTTMANPPITTTDNIVKGEYAHRVWSNLGLEVLDIYTCGASIDDSVTKLDVHDALTPFGDTAQIGIAISSRVIIYLTRKSSKP